MKITRIDVSERMSQAHAVYTAGQVALGAPGASITDQTADILSRIDELLAKAGTDKSKLLSASIWLSDIRDFNEMNLGLARQCPGARLCRITAGRAEVQCRDCGHRRGRLNAKFRDAARWRLEFNLPRGHS
jgi:enamine deaminase RidA (YjgF/YER057c/UK114 family)